MKNYLRPPQWTVHRVDPGEDTAPLPTLNWNLDDLMLTPWVEGFTGNVDRVGSKYVAYGKWEVDFENATLHITELPPGTWTDPYISKLQDLAKGSLIREIANNSTESFVDITILCNSEALSEVKNIVKQFFLSSDVHVGNMRAFSPLSKDSPEKVMPIKFEKVEEIIDSFIPVRLEYYTKRKKYLLQKLSEDATLLKNRVRFVREVVDGTLQVVRRTKLSLIESLKLGNYDTSDDGYVYLLTMHIVSFTEDLALELNEKYEKMLRDIDEVQNTTENDFWWKDLAELEEALKEFYYQRNEERHFSLCSPVAAKKPRKRKKRMREISEKTKNPLI